MSSLGVMTAWYSMYMKPSSRNLARGTPGKRSQVLNRGFGYVAILEAWYCSPGPALHTTTSNASAAAPSAPRWRININAWPAFLVRQPTGSIMDVPGATFATCPRSCASAASDAAPDPSCASNREAATCDADCSNPAARSKAATMVSRESTTGGAATTPSPASSGVAAGAPAVVASPTWAAVLPVIGGRVAKTHGRGASATAAKAAANTRVDCPTRRPSISVLAMNASPKTPQNAALFHSVPMWPRDWAAAAAPAPALPPAPPLDTASLAAALMARGVGNEDGPHLYTVARGTTCVVSHSLRVLAHKPRVLLAALDCCLHGSPIHSLGFGFRSWGLFAMFQVTDGDDA